MVDVITSEYTEFAQSYIAHARIILGLFFICFIIFFSFKNLLLSDLIPPQWANLRNFQEIIYRRLNSRQNFPHMISVKTLIFCNIPRIKSQRIHPVISRKKQSSEVVIPLRHDNHIRLIKNIFTESPQPSFLR